eukprot:592760-Hanusia_phi.AAC.2
MNKGVIDSEPGFIFGWAQSLSIRVGICRRARPGLLCGSSSPLIPLAGHCHRGSYLGYAPSSLGGKGTSVDGWGCFWCREFHILPMTHYQDLHRQSCGKGRVG